VLNRDFPKLKSEEVKEVNKGDDEEGCDLGVNSIYLLVLV
jgi:hypothetical protein